MRERIKENLEYLKGITATPGDGCTRLPFTREAREAVEYLKKIMEEAGLEVREDAAGNVIGVWRGEGPTLPCVMMGSHYDSVMQGGDYDGIAGVVCAVEVVRSLREKGIVPKRDLVVVGFCDEEGVRFGTGYFGSGAILGERGPAYCQSYRDPKGISIYEAMKAYGLDPEKIGEAAWPEGSIRAFLEIHIEQGPVLDAEGVELGLVEGIVGIQRYAVSVLGRADHAGTTPMEMRHDAAEAAAKVMARIPDWAREEGEGTVATVGYIHTVPGGMNIVAERVEFTVDIRSMDNGHICRIADNLREALEQETKKIGGSYEIETKLATDPTPMSREMLGVLEESCRERGYSYRYLPSGAGHDAQEMAKAAPAAMLFVPSRAGRSHCPEEYTEYEDLARAAEVMGELAEQLII